MAGNIMKVGQMKKDMKRTQSLEGLGIKVVRFNNHQVNTNIDGVIEKLIDTILHIEGSK